MPMRGAPIIRGQAPAPEAEHGRALQASAHGRKGQTIGTNMAGTDSAIGSSWA